MKNVTLLICGLLIAFGGIKTVLPQDNPDSEKAPSLTASDLIKNIEDRIFYPDEQENLESAEYTLIYGPQILMKQFNQKLEYGNKAKAKGKESGSFKPESLRKKEQAKKPADKKDNPDKARTWPDYDVTMGFVKLTDPANLLMCLFITPLHRTFPAESWNSAVEENDDGYQLTFIPKIPRPISSSDPMCTTVNSVAIAIDNEFMPTKLTLSFNQSFAKGLDLPGISKIVDDSEIEITFTEYKGKLLIKELKQVVHSGSPNPQPPMFALNLTPVYIFTFKEKSGFMLPSVIEISLLASELSGTLGGMDMHFLVEYLDYKVKPKAKK